MIPFMLNTHVEGIVIDGASGQAVLADEMKSAGVKKKPVLPKVNEVVEAYTLFEQAVFGSRLCHGDQPSLEQIVSNCEHRAIGSGGGYGYSSILEGADVSLLDAVVLAHWACATDKEKRVQRVIV